jgi:hypothetical protein
MNEQQAETAITLSLLVTGGLYTYRKLTEPEVGEGTSPAIAEQYKSVFGAAPLIGWAEWIKAAGVLYIGLAIIGAASPTIGGTAAILVGATAAFGNWEAVQTDLKLSTIEKKPDAPNAGGQGAAGAVTPAPGPAYYEPAKVREIKPEISGLSH